MSEFRIFCIAAFVGTGLSAAVADHNWAHFIPGDVYARLIFFAILAGSIAVTLFGLKAA